MDFSDELAEIVRKQKVNGEQTISDEAMAEVAELLAEPGTYGYLVYVNRDKRGMGIVGLGDYTPEKLAFAHRAADGLIDDLTYGCEHAEED